MKIHIRMMKCALFMMMLMVTNFCMALTPQDTAVNLVKEITLKKLTTDDGFVLKGIGGGKDLYLPIQYGWNVKSLHVHLNMTYDATIKHYDSVTALVKDFPISSIQLEPGKANVIGWDIEIPAKYIKSPVVTLQIRRNWQERGVSCDNTTDAIGWVNVQGDSIIRYEYVVNDYVPDLSIFPAPFINSISLTKDQAIIMVPEQYSNQILEAAYYAANALYKRRTWRGLNLYGLIPSAVTDEMKSQNNIIIVGLASDLKALLPNTELPLKLNDVGQLIDSENKIIADERGVIMEITSPWNAKNAVMIVTGNTIGAVVKAAAALRVPHFEKRVIFNKYAFVDTVMNTQNQPIDWGNTLLSDLGYKDIVVYGSNSAPIKYELNLPTNKIPDGIDVALHYEVSPLLSGISNSYISARANDFPVSGEKIKVNNDDKIWKFHINGRNLLPGKNQITFYFNLKFHNMDCIPDDLSLAWGSIYADSKISVDFSDDDLSYTFADLDDIEQNISLFLPTKGTILDSKEIVQLVVNMATNIVNVNAFHIYDDNSDIQNKSKNSNIVYVGNMARNPILNSLRKEFPFCYVDNKVIVEPIIKPYLYMSEENPIGLLELIRSPYNQKQLFLLITAETPAGLDLVVDTFFNPDKNQFLRGNTALIYSDGTFTSVNTNKLEVKAKNDEKMQVTKKMVLKIVIVIGVVLFGGMLLIIIYRRAKRYFSKNTNIKE